MSKADLGSSVLDNCIRHNKKCQESGNTKDMLSMQDIVGNVNIFVFAGTDTSQNTTELSLCRMAEIPDMIKLLQTASDRVYDKGSWLTSSARLEGDLFLSLWLKEALRMNTAPLRSLARQALEYVTIKDIKIKKGDIVCEDLQNIKCSPIYFKDPELFKPDRFSKPMSKDVERYAYNPFWQGKRNWIGKNLGQIMILIIVTQFCKMYDFKKPDGIEYIKKQIVLVTEGNPWIDIKIRNLPE